MIVSAVGQNEHSNINTIVASTAVGAGTGYALKYLWPVTNQEAIVSDNKLQNFCYKITNNAKADEFRKLPERTKAQDCFVKMIEDNDKEAFLAENITKKVKSLGGEQSTAGKEFRGIIRTVDECAHQASKLWKKASGIALKIKRPVVPFLVAGAGLGFLAGFTHNVLKTDA